jgi:hypothetical protein
VLLSFVAGFPFLCFCVCTSLSGFQFACGIVKTSTTASIDYENLTRNETSPAVQSHPVPLSAGAEVISPID